MNRKIMGAALGLAILAASSAASAHLDVAIGLGLPVALETAPSVYVGTPVAYERPPVPVVYRGDGGWVRGNGVSAANGGNMSGAGNRGANINGAKIIAGVAIEKKSNSSTFGHLNHRVLSDESWFY